MTTKTLVAVYGSLRRGLHNHVLLEQADYVSRETLPGFKMYSMSAYPYITPTDPSDEILVELYLVTTEELSRLDTLEGYPGFYSRKLVATSQGNAWIYFISTDNPTEPPVTSGDWFSYYNSRTNYA